MKILLLDIETSPNTAYVWGLFKQHINVHQLIDSSYTLCWAAKWYGEKELFFASKQHGMKTMLKEIHKLLTEADVVVHYNGTKFDIPILNKEFILYGMSPPAPFKQVDLLKISRNQFKFPSNRLDFVAERLGLGNKIPTEHSLWVGCMENNEESWKMMEKYNKHDIVLLERVYDRFLPWIKSHPNNNVYQQDSMGCPNCGSTKFQRRGYSFAQALKYQRYQCTGCGNWFKASKACGRNPQELLRNIS